MEPAEAEGKQAAGEGGRAAAAAAAAGRHGVGRDHSGRRVVRKKGMRARAERRQGEPGLRAFCPAGPSRAAPFTCGEAALPPASGWFHVVWEHGVGAEDDRRLQCMCILATPSVRALGRGARGWEGQGSGRVLRRAQTIGSHVGREVPQT